GPPGSRLADVAVVPTGVTGGTPEVLSTPLFLDIEYYLERQVAPALHRLFMLVRGPNGQQGYVDVRRWIAAGYRPKRRDVAAVLSSAQRDALGMAKGPVCVACGQRGSLNNFICSACQEGDAVPRLLTSMSHRQFWERRLQVCREECLRCTGSFDIEADCRSIYCENFFRKANAEVQLRACVAPTWPTSLESFEW
ncbi:unnamed protein product, partial [Durusdinium trenchii]